MAMIPAGTCRRGRGDKTLGRRRLGGDPVPARSARALSVADDLHHCLGARRPRVDKTTSIWRGLRPAPPCSRMPAAHVVCMARGRIPTGDSRFPCPGISMHGTGPAGVPGGFVLAPQASRRPRFSVTMTSTVWCRAAGGRTAVAASDSPCGPFSRTGRRTVPSDAKQTGPFVFFLTWTGRPVRVMYDRPRATVFAWRNWMKT